jgi:hypothetical protein
MKKPSFRQIIIQEKCDSDFRGFCICADKDGDMWELRGVSADNPSDAAKNAYESFLDYENWDCYGYAYDCKSPEGQESFFTMTFEELGALLNEGGRINRNELIFKVEVIDDGLSFLVRSS